MVACGDDETIPNPKYPSTVDGGDSLSLPSQAQDLVIYEVNLRAFSAQGNLKGVEAGLDHIQSLGVNCLWLMPIHPVGQLKGINSPYSIRDYRKVGSEYGSMADLKSLVNAAHQRGIAVMMDWVANHTAWDHPWINRHPDWYTQDAQGNIIHPPGTNWLDVADLNFSVPVMRDSMIASMQYWIDEVNIDGFRCDYADGVEKDFWQQAIGQLRAQSNKTLFLLAEGVRADHQEAGFDLMFSWDFYHHLKQAFTIGAPLSDLRAAEERESAAADRTPRLRFTTNHDESAWDQTPVQLFGGLKPAFAAFAISTFSGGIPLIYSSQEVGRNNTLPFFSNDPIDWTQNPEYLLQYQELMEQYNRYVPQRTLSQSIPHNHIYLQSFDDPNQSGRKGTLIVAINSRGNYRRIDWPAEFQGEAVDLLSGANITIADTSLLPAYAVKLLLFE